MLPPGVEPNAPQRWSQAALLGIAVYVVLDVALVFLRPRFSVLHNAESDYGSRGPYGWVMDVNFVIRGLLSLTIVAALLVEVGDRARLRAGPWTLAVWALGSALLAFFPDDPVGTKTTGAGKVHLVLAVIAFVAVVVGTFLTLRELRGDGRFAPVRLPLLVLAIAALVALLLLGHAGLHPRSLGALWEKVFLGLELAWFGLLAAWIVRLGRGRGSAAAAVAG
jgi:hypothetical membrane protein